MVDGLLLFGDFSFFEVVEGLGLHAALHFLPDGVFSAADVLGLLFEDLPIDIMAKKVLIVLLQGNLISLPRRLLWHAACIVGHAGSGKPINTGKSCLNRLILRIKKAVIAMGQGVIPSQMQFIHKLSILPRKLRSRGVD